MSKIELNAVSTITGINANFQQIEDELNNKVLYRDNPVGEPNTISQDMDANGFTWFNLREPVSPNEAARLQDVQNAVVGGSANLISFTPSGSISATTVQGAIQELDGDIQGHITAVSNAHNSSAISYVQNGTGAITRSVRDRLRDRVSVKDFGAVGDGVTDDAVAFQNALTYTSVNNKTLFIPAGEYKVSTNLSTNLRSVSVIGEGVSETRIIFTTTSGGFSFGLTGQGAGIPPDQLYLKGFTIETNATIAASAISAEWSVYQANAQGQCWIQDIHITRADNGTGSFGSGIRLSRCFVGFVDRIVILGDDARVSNIGIEVVDCVGVRFSNIDVNRYKTGARLITALAAQTEGIFFRDCFLYDVNQGVNIATQSIHVNIIGTHININSTSALNAISMINCSQCMVKDCLIYVGGLPGDAANQDGIVALGGAGNIISGNLFNGTTAANVRDGVRADSGFAFSSITDNHFSFFTTGVRLVTTTGVRVLSNEVFSTTTPYVDGGNTSTIRGQTASGVPFPSTTGFRIYANAGQAISAATSTVMTFGTTAFDDITETNGAAGTFTAKYAGNYEFVAAATGTQVTSTRRLIDLYVNGVIRARMTDNSAEPGTTTINGNSGAIKLSLGDVVTARYFSTLADTLVAGESLTFFTGHQISY